MKNRWIVLMMSLMLLTSVSPVLKGISADENFTLAVKPACGFNILTWTPVENATSYWIYRGLAPNKEASTPLTDFPIQDTTFNDDINIENGKQYCYYVTAVNANAEQFKTSNEACATPQCFERDECKLEMKFQVDNKNYWVNGVQKGPMEAAPIVKLSRTLILIKYVTQEIQGTKLEWVAETKTVIITTVDGHVIKLQIGNKMATVDDKPIQIDPNNDNVTPIIVSGRTLVPFRFVAENLGATGPDDVKWFADTKTIVLYFANPDCDKCEWVKGIITSVSPITATLAAISGFKVEFQLCTGELKTVYVTSDAKDTTGKFPISQYKGCSELCIYKNQIKQWKAYPDEKNCCGVTPTPDCTEIRGKIMKVSPVLFGSTKMWVISFDECPLDDKPAEYVVESDLKDSAGKTISQYTGCAVICIDANKKVVKWSSLPDTDCCTSTECDWQLVKIDKVEMPPSTTGTALASVYCFVCKEGSASAEPIKFLAEYTLTDQEKKVPIGRYTGCAKICVGPNNRIVKWIALPNLEDCCKPVTDNCTWVKATITGTNQISDTVTAITIIICSDATDPKETTVMVTGDMQDDNKKFSILKYTGCAKLCIKDGSITRWIAYPDVKDCCEKPVECKTIRGKIVKVTYNENGKRWVIQFEPCNPNDPKEPYAASDLMDTTGEYTLSKYTGCAEICIKDRFIQSWKALPDEECCPKKPTECRTIRGKIVKVFYNEDGKRWVIQFEPCNPNDQKEPYCETDMLDKSGKYQLSQYTGCAEICIRERFIQSWKALPDEECCPQSTDCKPVRGKITKTTYNEDSKRWVVYFLQCGYEKEQELFTEKDLLDKTGKFPISQYLGCAEMCIKDRIILWWKALPNEECCPSELDCDWIKGQFQKSTFDQASNQWVVIFDDCPIDTGKRYFCKEDMTDGSGKFPISQYNGCAKLCVKDGIILKWIAYPDVKNCCEETPTEVVVKDCVCFKVGEVDCNNGIVILVDETGRRWKTKLDNMDICKSLKVGDCVKLCNFKKIGNTTIELLPEYQFIINGCACKDEAQKITVCVKIAEVNCDLDIPKITGFEIGKDTVWTLYLPNRDLCGKIEEGSCWIVTGYKTQENAIKVISVQSDPNCECKPAPMVRCFCMTVDKVEKNCDKGIVYVWLKSGQKIQLNLPDELKQFCEKIVAGSCWSVCGIFVVNTDGGAAIITVTKLEPQTCPCPEPPTQQKCICVTIKSVTCEQNFATGFDSAGVMWNIVFDDKEKCALLKVGANFQICGTITSTNPPAIKVETVKPVDGQCPAAEPTCICVTLRDTACSGEQPMAYVVDENGKSLTIYLKSAEACGKLEPGKCYRVCGYYETLATGETIMRSTSWENVPCPCGAPKEDCWCIEVDQIDCANSARSITVKAKDGQMYQLQTDRDDLCNLLQPGSCFKVCGTKIVNDNTQWIFIKVTSVTKVDCPCSADQVYTLEVNVSENHCWISPPLVVAKDLKTGKRVEINIGKDGLCDLLLVGKCFKLTTKIPPTETTDLIRFTVQNAEEIKCP